MELVAGCCSQRSPIINKCTSALCRERRTIRLPVMRKRKKMMFTTNHEAARRKSKVEILGRCMAKTTFGVENGTRTKICSGKRCRIRERNKNGLSNEIRVETVSGAVSGSGNGPLLKL
ncbi:hypothetical protein EVAR_49799_1 [Eumeta japonica]|uniref:Uncharacterized protein n=1 Tax=Eumeta variegata TaxID=151549 RepID=A0A4C1YUM9_EUMVA|nr:hypothetical protein EVAR_49799_1 [Eumeta japonica]